MKHYGKYLLKRVFYMFITLFLITTTTFLLMNFLPGTPYSNQEKMTDKQIEIMNEQYGLNKPLPERYVVYMKGIVKGDFGVSFQFSNQPVSSLLSKRMGPSIQLGIQAVIFGSIVGIALGALSAVYQHTWIDTIASLLSIIGRSVPNFVFAVLLQLFFAIQLKILPIALWDQGFKSTILPTIALSIAPMADCARFIRSELAEVLNSDYIELARAKGLSNFQVVFKHGLRNALIPLITILGPTVVSLMTGSLVVENIFSIPGIGEQFVKSIMTSDYPTIMAVTIIYSTMLVVIMLVVDILYGIIDPRIRLEEDD